MRVGTLAMNTKASRESRITERHLVSTFTHAGIKMNTKNAIVILPNQRSLGSLPVLSMAAMEIVKK